MSSSSISPPSSPCDDHMVVESSSLPPCRHLRVQLGDSTLVKHLLDEQAAMYLLDRGYTEDVTLSNCKIGIGVACLLLTAITHFLPMLMPSINVPFFVKTCVVIYFLMQGIQQLLYLTVERDCIIHTKKRDPNQQRENSNNKNASGSKKNKKVQGKTSSSSSSSNANLPTAPISLSANLDRYDTKYELTLATRASQSLLPWSSSKTPASQLVSVKSTIDFTQLFDSNGVLLLEKYQNILRQLLEDYTKEVNRCGSKKQQ